MPWGLVYTDKASVLGRSKLASSNEGFHSVRDSSNAYVLFMTLKGFKHGELLTQNDGLFRQTSENNEKDKQIGHLEVRFCRSTRD